MIADISAIDESYKKIMDGFEEQVLAVRIIPERDENICDVFKRSFVDDR